MTHQTTQCNGCELLNRPGLNIAKDVSHTLISLGPIFCVMDARVAERVKGNDRINFIRAVICTPVDVMTLKVWPATTIVEWRGLIAAFTYALCSSQHVSRNRCGSVVNVALPARSWSLISGVYCTLTEYFIRFRVVRFNDFFKSILAKSFTADQVEDHLLNSVSGRTDVYFTVPVIKPFAVKPVFAIFFEKEKNRSTILHVVADLVIVVFPRVPALGTLTIILVCSVRKKTVMVTVSVPVGIGHYNHSVLVFAVANAFELVAAKCCFDVLATTKPESNVLMPRHALPLHSLPQAVSTAASCICVKEDR